ncbi:MAG TPA: hypothetical protein VL461_06325 [Dictyobacter sp.]|nr:hypothetical protein [Dictyobacter sp.]
MNKRVVVGKGKIQFSFAALCSCLLVLLAIGVRLFMILNHWPPTNSDEAAVGLMSLHISQGRDFPFFMYGQAELGALEAYIGAGLFLIFGPSITVLRLGLLFLFFLFLVVLYYLTRRLYTRGLAMVTLFLMSFGTIESISRSIPATLGHAETPLFCAIIVLLSVYIALHSITPYREMSASQRRKCLILYVLWGLMSGLALWNDELAGAFILVSALFICVFALKTLRVTTIVSLLLALGIGLLPLIMHDVLFNDGQAMLSNGQHSLSVVNLLGVSTQTIPLWQRLEEGVMVALPLATGASGICYIQPPDAWPVSLHSSAYVLQCTAAHSVWGFFFIIIWLLAVILAVRQLYQLIKASRRQGDIPDIALTQETVIQGARLMLLIGAAFAWLIFSSSMQVVGVAWSTRYLISMIVATPAVLWPLWSLITAKRDWLPAKRGVQILCSILLLTFMLAEVKGTVRAYTQFPTGMPLFLDQDAMTNTQQEHLANTLVSLHVQHMYTDYWTCNLMIFLSHEQVLCSVISYENLDPGFNRYPPYASVVRQDPQSAYLLHIGSPQIAELNVKLAREKKKYQVKSFDGYLLYRFPQ